MKILLLSDTHCVLYKVYQIYQTLDSIDLILHCGDCQKDARELEENLGVPVISVQGNSDGVTCPDWKVVDTPYGKILTTHGHMEDVEYGYDKLIQLAKANDCFAVCYGHTHVPVCEYFDSTYVINPGSLSLPRDNSDGSYAILQITEDEFDAAVIYAGDDPKESLNVNSNTKVDRLDYLRSLYANPRKEKVKGGFLRRLFNNSDRF